MLVTEQSIMIKNFEKYYQNSLFIRKFEELLLRLFNLGLLNGTTHTSIGQELIAVTILDKINTDDVVISNHRCHAHFLAYCNEADLLLKELMGKSDGICNGIAGSQHIHYKNFYSNGVLGNLIPVSAGIAMSLKMSKKNSIVYIFMGDGVFGQGVVYETLNICSLYNLKCLFIVENNKIAQTTSIEDNFAGSFSRRFSSFGIENKELSFQNLDKFFFECEKAQNYILEKNRPFALIIDTERLSAHSKGDDTRSKEIIINLQKQDPLKILEKKISFEKVDKINKEIANKIDLLIKKNKINL
jgi:TPP-dependent pyruvate/acetoin dehydrogenase alpha subunit